MNLIFAGTPEPALPALEALLASEHDVRAVITRPDAPSGRGRALRPSPVAERAIAAGIDVLRPRRVRDPEFVDRLRAIDPDCVPIVAYGALIPQQVIDLPRHGWVNLHFSLLPAWRGAAPVQRAIMNGDQTTGASTFSLVAELDAGPVYDMITEPIGPRDTAGDLLHRLSVRGADLLVRTLTGIEAGTCVAKPQPSTGISLAPKLDVEEGRIDWTRSSSEIDRQVRACTPAPGAWTTFRGERFKIISMTPAEGSPELAAGALSIAKRSVLVGTGDGTCELLAVQPPGKKPMAAPDWGRGVSVDDHQSGRSETLGQ